MPHVRVVFFREADGSVPALEWFHGLAPKAQEKCMVRLERLRENGHELRRPEAAYLRDGVFELRARHQRVHYRLLYFFHGTRAVVLSHGLVKRDARVPAADIDRAVERKALYERDPVRHTQQE